MTAATQSCGHNYCGGNMVVYSVCRVYANSNIAYQILPYDLKGAIKTNLQMNKGTFRLMSFLKMCRFTQKGAWKLKVGMERKTFEREKRRIRKRLKKLGYTKQQMAFVDDIVSIERPGVARIKEQIDGEYTGRLVEIYL